MKRKRLFHQKQKQSLSVRTVLAISITFSVIVVIGLYFSFFITTPNKSKASGDFMILSRINVTQLPRDLYRGTLNNTILRVEIVTRGSKNPLELKQILFNARGSSKPYSEHIKSARLWYTNKHESFSPHSTFGLSISGINVEDENLKYDDTYQLSEGSNYFWLTYDIINRDCEDLTVIDAECLSVQIGSIDYRPDMGSPSGIYKLHNSRSWYAFRDGELSDLTCWNSKRDGSGIKPNNIDGNSGAYIILPGRFMQNKLGTSLPNILIENRGRLFSSASLKCQNIRILAKGILRIDDIDDNIPKQIEVEDNGTYIHNNNLPLPKSLKLSQNSILWLTKPPKPDSNTSNFITGNIILDFKNSFPFNLAGITNQINGSIEIQKSDKRGFIYYSDSIPLVVNKNLIINGGVFAFTINNENSEIIINGNFIGNAGELINQPYENKLGTSIIYLAGDMIINNISIDLSRDNTSPATIIIKGNNQSKWNQDKIGSRLCNIIIEENSSLHLTGKYLGNIPSGCTLKVMKNAYFNCKEAIVKGNGIFKLQPFAKIGIGSKDGISTNEQIGNIQTLVRNYSHDAIFNYNGFVPIQNSGKFTTSNGNTEIREFILNMKSKKSYLILEQNLIVNQQVKLLSGNVIYNNYEICEFNHQTILHQ